MEELKRAVQVSEAEREKMRIVVNPLLRLLDDFEFYEPVPPTAQSPIIEEIVEKGEEKRSDKEKGDESEEEEKKIKIDEPELAAAKEARPPRRDRGKAIMEEMKDVPVETNPEKELIYLEQLGTAILADELQFNLSQTFEKKRSDFGREAEDDELEPEGERD